jgi:hypothetical protein
MPVPRNSAASSPTCQSSENESGSALSGLKPRSRGPDAEASEAIGLQSFAIYSWPSGQRPFKTRSDNGGVRLHVLAVLPNTLFMEIGLLPEGGGIKLVSGRGLSDPSVTSPAP